MEERKKMEACQSSYLLGKREKFINHGTQRLMGSRLYEENDNMVQKQYFH